MLYELIAVVRPGKLTEVKEIARAAGSLIISRQGVVRDIKNWGTFLLTKPKKKHTTRYIDGHHFVMRFDASPTTQEAVRKMLGLDPRMIRFGIVKISNQTLLDHADIGPIRWSRKPSATRPPTAI
ncbi:MAG: hypothetical protein MMC23_005497 [Stictis urceolatum]|nr:hypothetical protein [Stictis urceolata]